MHPTRFMNSQALRRMKAYLILATLDADPSLTRMGTRVCSLILSKRSANMGSRVTYKKLLANIPPRSLEITLPRPNDGPKSP